MLEGIEVLSRVSLRDCNQFLIVFGFIIFYVAIITLMVADSKFKIGSSIVMFMVSVLLIILFFTTKSEPYIQYKVTISDKVSMIEFNKKYKIINQEGKIYTIEEIRNTD